MLPVKKYEYLNKPEWKPRRWPWVDPLKDIQASVLSIRAGVNSPQNIAAEQGRDFNVVIEEIAQAQKIAEEKGVALPALTTDKVTMNVPPDKETEDDEEEKDK